MSFRRILTLKNAIPVRGLEEFVEASSTAGKDIVYGASSRCG